MRILFQVKNRTLLKSRKIDVLTSLRMKDLDLIKGKTNLQHIGVGCSTRKLMTTCHSQFFDFTKLLSSLQTQVISFSAFKLSPIIAVIAGSE